MRGKFYAAALVAAFAIAALGTPDASAQYYRPACTSSYYAAPVYYAAPAYYAPTSYGYSGYGYSGYARPAYSYSGYGSTYGYGTYSSGYTPVFGGFRGYYGY